MLSGWEGGSVNRGGEMRGYQRKWGEDNQARKGCHCQLLCRCSGKDAGGTPAVGVGLPQGGRGRERWACTQDEIDGQS